MHAGYQNQEGDPTEKYQLTNFTRLPLRISKVKEGNFTWTNCGEKSKS